MHRAAIHQVHRVMRKALNDAVRSGYLIANPAAQARIPRGTEFDEEPEPFAVEEIQRVFRAASRTRNGARFVIALALGLRQGEALGLKWTDVDLANQVLYVRRSALRPRYEHGCTAPCGHAHGGYCPERRLVRPPTSTTKSRAGRRTVGIPDPLVALLRQHHAQQLKERRNSGSLWNEQDWVFTNEIGAAINPRTDWSHWKALLRVAGVRDSRLHDARHTAATCLLLLGTNPRATTALMGWTDPSMMQRYQHLTSPLRTEVAGQLGSLLWGDSPARRPSETATPTATLDDEPGI
jgi:integrase